jgi:NYN domain/OST-HTH/LOTUS domain
MANDETQKSMKLALLIDGDNVRADFLPIIIREASAIGTITVRRVYGHYASSTMNKWQKLLHEYALTPIHVPPAATGKNATDMKLAIEAMDLLHQGKLDGFCIASSDSDFTNLASRIREDGLPVFGFGEQKSTAPYIAACTRFFYCDLLLAEEKQEPGTKKMAVPTKEILSAIDDASGDDGWAHLGAIGQILNKLMPDFDPRNYGYRKLSDLMAGMKGVSTRRVEANGGLAVFVRRKEAGASGRG